MTGKIQTNQTQYQTKFQKKTQNTREFQEKRKYYTAEKLINCTTQAVGMPPAGVSMLRFLATVFLAVAK
jgi:predicted ATP-dependent Lon-type protease